jgi:hypothetical protein
MADKWYYSHNGRTEGPFTSAQMKDRAAGGQLHEDDPVWAEGADPQGAIPARGVLPWPARQATAAVAAPPPAPAVPDWLSDIDAVEGKGRAAGAPSEVPDWLEDLRLWVGLDLFTPAYASVL